MYTRFQVLLYTKFQILLYTRFQIFLDTRFQLVYTRFRVFLYKMFKVLLNTRFQIYLDTRKQDLLYTRSSQIPGSSCSSKYKGPEFPAWLQVLQYTIGTMFSCIKGSTVYLLPVSPRYDVPLTVYCSSGFSCIEDSGFSHIPGFNI